jgi:hypothetical protein
MSGEREGPASAGAWVLIHEVALPAGRRAPGIPPETQAVPLEMRVKGFLTGGPAVPGDRVTVKTLTGRMVTGILMAVSPPIPHTFGSPVPELLAVGPELRDRLRRADGDGGDAPPPPRGGGNDG